MSQAREPSSLIEHCNQLTAEHRALATQHETLLDIVRRVADLNKRYPPDCLYSRSAILRINAEMKAINHDAVAAITKIEAQQSKEKQNV